MRIMSNTFRFLSLLRRAKLGISIRSRIVSSWTTTYRNWLVSFLGKKMSRGKSVVSKRSLTTIERYNCAEDDLRFVSRAFVDYCSSSKSVRGPVFAKNDTTGRGSFGGLIGRLLVPSVSSRGFIRDAVMADFFPSERREHGVRERAVGRF